MACSRVKMNQYTQRIENPPKKEIRQVICVEPNIERRLDPCHVEASQIATTFNSVRSPFLLFIVLHTFYDVIIIIIIILCLFYLWINYYVSASAFISTRYVNPPLTGRLTRSKYFVIVNLPTAFHTQFVGKFILNLPTHLFKPHVYW
jgi:hypothetical protein